MSRSFDLFANFLVRPVDATQAHLSNMSVRLTKYKLITSSYYFKSRTCQKQHKISMLILAKGCFDCARNLDYSLAQEDKVVLLQEDLGG